MTTRRALLLSASVIVILIVGYLLMQGLKPAREFPKGVQTVHALIQPAPLDLNRRGTYQLLTGSTLFAYAESQSVNLRPFEGQVVELTGTYEANIRASDPPLLVVTAVKGTAASNTKAWKIPSLQLELRTPLDWKSVKVAKGIGFGMSGTVTPVLTAMYVPYVEAEFTDTAGHTLVSVGGLRAVSSILANVPGDGLRLQVDRGAFSTIPPESRILQFDFVFPKNTPKEKELYESIVQSIRINAASSNSAMSRDTYGVSSLPNGSNTSMGAGSWCGGVAGILCPAGFYCNITDKASNSGKCVGI